MPGIQQRDLAGLVMPNEQIAGIGGDDKARAVGDPLAITIGRSEAMEAEARR